jgi:hypothetical protein
MDAMIGYLLYDTVIELAFVPKLDCLLLVHHLLGLTSHILTRMQNNWYFAHWSMMVYLAEVRA